eukprot:4830570-Amphidinium_carterae.1
MPRDHGRSKDLQNIMYPRSKVLGLHTKRRVGIARHTASHVDLINDIHELARHRPTLKDYTVSHIHWQLQWWSALNRE